MDGKFPESGDQTGEDSMHLSPAEIRKLGYRIVDMIANDLSDPSGRPVFPLSPSIEELETAFGGPPPEAGMSPGEILDVIEARLIAASGNHNHPFLMANVLTGAMPLAGLLEALVSALKIRPTTWKNQPASCFIEATVARWLGAMVGFAPDAAGYMTTGGSWANMVGLTMARVHCAGWDVRAEGVAGRAPLVAYASREVHSCFDRAVELLGIGREGLRKIEVDRNFRIVLDELEAQIRKDLDSGLKPFCVVGQAGTVNTGAVDDLSALAGIAQRYNLWFHVDGSYGAFARLDPQARPLFSGIDRADSLSVDPHKWLNTPFEAGCILTKDAAHLEKTFSATPSYLRPHLGGGLDQYQRGFELSRTDRALKVWVALKQHGTALYAQMITHHLALARALAEIIRKSEDLEIMSEPVLSICCFRYVPPGIDRGEPACNRYLDELNRAITDALITSGRAYVSATELRGRYVLRACIVSYQVTQGSIENVVEIVRSAGSELHAQRHGRAPSAIPPSSPGSDA